MPNQQDLKTLKKDLDLQYNKLTKKTGSILNYSDKITKSKSTQIPLHIRKYVKEYAALKMGKMVYLDTFPDDVRKEIKKHARNFTDIIDRRKCSFEINPLQKDIVDYIRTLDQFRTRLRKIDPLKLQRKNDGLKITPSDVLEKTLLNVLKKSGGKTHISHVFEEMEKILLNELTDDDREIISEPRERWKINVSWKRYDLVERGIMTKDTPRGIWMIERKYLKKR